jgi:hypothetical protein
MKRESFLFFQRLFFGFVLASSLDNGFLRRVVLAVSRIAIAATNPVSLMSACSALSHSDHPLLSTAKIRRILAIRNTEPEYYPVFMEF